jgi:hypothetical protein
MELRLQDHLLLSHGDPEDIWHLDPLGEPKSSHTGWRATSFEWQAIPSESPNFKGEDMTKSKRLLTDPVTEVKPSKK